jgi:hypothetical protein
MNAMTRQELDEIIKRRQDEMGAMSVLCSHTVIAQEDCVTVGPIT